MAPPKKPEAVSAKVVEPKPVVVERSIPTPAEPLVPGPVEVVEKPKPQAIKCPSVRFMSSLIIGAQQLSFAVDGKEYALSVINNGVKLKMLTGQGKTFLVPFANCASVELAE